MTANLFVARGAHLIKGSIAGLSLNLIAASSPVVPRKSPSSLQKPGVVVHFSHAHQRVASCKLQAATLTCSAHKVAVAADAELTLTPTAGELVSKPGPLRQPISVSLPSRPGVSNLDVRVETGDWTLAWADQQAAFHVEAQHDFSVQLQTTSGSCIFEAGQCRRHDEPVARKVVIPPELQGVD
jgi:hypothetical protein